MKNNPQLEAKNYKVKSPLAKAKANLDLGLSKQLNDAKKQSQLKLIEKSKSSENNHISNSQAKTMSMKKEFSSRKNSQHVLPGHSLFKVNQR